MRRWSLLAPALLMLCACGPIDFGGASGPPEFEGVPGGPTDPPPTGSKWQGVVVEGECGRLSLEWVLVDEVCGGTDAPDYLDYFRAPMMRDGARIGDWLYTVDATHLWVLNVADDAAPARELMSSGLGQPLAVVAHNGALLVAAGDAGLLQLDLSDPLAPTIAAQLTLPGPALDIHVDGDTAFVTTGHAGVAVVDVTGAPQLSHLIATPGSFAAGVKAQDGLAYIAACDTFMVADVASGQLLSQTWVNGAYHEDILVAPAKDVELVGDTAFVAAGRYGAVAVDVSDPQAASIQGNCTVAEDMGFYASGVRAQNDRLFVAGGEWGILPVDVTEPVAACNVQLMPALPSLPQDGGDCETEAPWEIVEWQETFPPPLPGRDPIQTLPFGDVLYAFGDARRIGMRAVDIRNALLPDLDKIGRYDEPRLATGIAAMGNRVVVLGPAGGTFLYDDQLLLVPEQPIAEAQTARSVTMLDDGRYVLATDDQLLIEGQPPVPLMAPVGSQGLAAEGTTIAVPLEAGAALIDADAQSTQMLVSGAEAELPQAVALAAGEVYVASPEWTAARHVGLAEGVALAEHGAFTLDEVMSASRWRTGLPRRLLVTAGPGLIGEVATLGHRAVLALHGAPADPVLLPSGEYVAAYASEDYIYLITASRGSYRSELITVHLLPDGSSSLSLQAFTGLATDIAGADGRLYIADADRGVRVYDISAGLPSALGVVEMQEVTP